MSPTQIASFIVSIVQQFGLVPYIQGALLIAFAIAAISLVRRAFQK